MLSVNGSCSRCQKNQQKTLGIYNMHYRQSTVITLFSFSCYFSTKTCLCICTVQSHIWDINSCPELCKLSVLLSGVTINTSCVNADTWGRCWHRASICESKARWLPACRHITCLRWDNKRCDTIQEKVDTYFVFFFLYIRLEGRGEGHDHDPPLIRSHQERSWVSLSQLSRAEEGEPPQHLP